jgi:hypothetical protein
MIGSWQLAQTGDSCNLFFRYFTEKKEERKEDKSFVGKFVGCCPHDLEILRHDQSTGWDLRIDSARKDCKVAFDQALSSAFLKVKRRR